MPSSTGLEIYEVYGGGGNSGSTYTNDFIVLHNTGSTAASLSGYTLQYASTTGSFSTSSSTSFVALSGVVAAGGYYLVQLAAGTGGTTALPTPDATGTINMSGTGGKVALASNSTAVTGPTGANVVDFVGWGTANAYEGTAAAPATMNTTAAYRLNNGVPDSDKNSVDFATGDPSTVAAAMPRNSSYGVSNAAPVFTGGSSATASTPENTPTTTTVYTAAATDADNDTLTYSLSGADAGKFNINAATGAVTFKASPDFEAPGSAAGTNVYSFNAVVMDGSPGNHTVSQAVTLSVTDVNDNAPVINSGNSAASTAFSVASGTAAGSTVYTVTATDVDTVNGARSYILGGTDASRFTLNPSSGALSFKAAPSYANPDDVGADHVYNITVQAYDGANYSATQAVAITVTANNVNPPVFTSGATATTPENVLTTTAVYTAHATDADGDTVAYSLAGGADAALFNIDPATGAVTFKASPDFEKPGSAAGTNTYSFTVQASDGLAAHNVTQAVTLSVTDVNDNAPVITSAATATAPAGVATTTPVYTVTATDADSGPALTYAITGGADAAKFNINATTGAVTFKASPSYAAPDDAGADHTYNIMVQASDGVAAHNATQAVAIAVTNPNAGVLFSADFDSYTAAGLSPGAANAYAGATAGTLNSNVFRAVGFSDANPGDATGYGGTTSGVTDYGRGALTANFSATTAGLYSGVTAHAGASDHALMILPTGAEFDVNGYVEVRVQNTTTSTVASLNTAFDWVYDNKNTRSDTIVLSYSTDGVNYTAAPVATNLVTPAAADATPGFTYLHESVDLTGVVVAPGAYLYLRFTHTGSTGAGSRDAVGLDNLNVGYNDVSHIPVLSVANISAAEGNSGTTAFTFTVQRAGDLSAATTVHYATADGTAMAGSDYTAVSGDLTFAAGETSKTVVVQVTGDVVQEPNETFTLNLSGAANATLQNSSATATIVNDDVSVTSIGDIQGAATTSPFVGQSVTTTGVVTAIKTGAGGGYYIQDPTNAGPAGASHGLFVFTAATPSVAVGDAVTVQGLVTEYAANANDRPITELNTPTTTVTSHGNAVTPVIIGAGGVLPPTSVIAGPTYDPVHNGADFYESLEGQLVTVHNAQATDASYSGSTWVVADLGAEATGMNARGGITSAAGDFDPERIQVYSTAVSATMGEHLGDITGVITYYNGEYELIPTQPITPPNAGATTPPTLPLETTTLKGDATHLAIAAYNVENLGPVQPGVAQATVDARFAALGSDIAKNLGGPAIVGLEEIQDSNGENPNPPPAANDPNYAADYAAYQASLGTSVTLTKLTGAITAAGGPAYSYVEIAPTTTNTNGGAPDGNIRPAILYDPTKVTYVAGSAHLIADPNLSDGDAFTNSRMPLAAQFIFNGQVVNVIEIHDYARSGSEELFGLDQPAVNSGDQRRIDQTAAVKAYVQQLQAADPNAKIVVQGDFNGFQFETTLTQLAHSGGGTLNQLSDLLPASERYSTTFEGISQEIDHALVSDSLNAGAQFAIVHLNTGQTTANQASDHDPIISLLSVPSGKVANTAPVLGGTGASTTGDHATDALFSKVTVTDPDGGQTETATIAYAASAGKLSYTAVTAGVTFAGAPGSYTLNAGSADALTTALQAVSFTPAAQPAGTAATQTVFALTVSDGVASTAPDTRTVVTTMHTTNTPAQAANATPAQAIDDQHTVQPFAGVTVTDPDTGQTETAAITYAAANGTLTGAGPGATFAGSAGSYTLSASSAAGLQSALQALVFTPTANQVAPGGTVATTLAVSVSDGASTAPTVSDTVTATSVNDAPVLGGLQSTATAPSSGSVALQPGLTVADPDVGAMVSSAQVSIAGFAYGDKLGVSGLPAGVAAAYNAQTGVLTLTGTGSDAAYQAALRTVTYSHDGTVDAGQRTVTFAVTDDQGATTRASETVNVGGYVQPATGGSGSGATQTYVAPDVQQAYPTQTDNLLRVSPTDPALSNPSSPIYAQAQAEAGIAARLDAGTLSLADAQNALYHLVDGTTSVAEITYAFFTGKTPTQAGLNYLVHSDANTTDLNDPYYAQFTTENRYINFSANLGRFGDGSTSAFHQAYDGLSLADATARAYAAIFGTAPTADKVSAILNSLVPDGQGGTETRAQYFAYYGNDGANGIGTKSAMIGFLLADSVKEGFGTYQQADQHFLQDLAHGTAAFNVDLLAAYGPAPTLVGQPTTDTSLHG